MQGRVSREELREPATPQEIWQILRESQHEIDRLLAQQAAEADQRSERDIRESRRRVREFHDPFTSEWSMLIDDLVDGDLIKLLRDRDIDVDHTMTELTKYEDGRPTVSADILAVTRQEVVVVEVRTTLKVRDVDRFVQALPQFTRLRREYQGRTIFGAVACLEADESSDVHAERAGLFVIRATGSSASITNQPDFTPRAFGR